MSGGTDPDGTEGAFIVTLDDGLLTSPRAVGVGNDAIMSDDEGRTIVTLEATPKSSTSGVGSGGRVMVHSSQSGGVDRRKEDLLAKMKSRLSKQIDLKMVSAPKVAPPLDTSGSIEIPQDLILGSDIPATPLATGASKELEDHDLIAILEGDDVEITEGTTEIEVRVGGGGDDGVYSDEQVLEEIQISFVDEHDMSLEQKEIEKSIAMRQMAALPVLPKGRRPKKRLEESPGKVVAPPKVVKTEVVKPAEPAKMVTIKGQTIIKPVPRPMVIPKKEPVEKETPRVVTPLSKPKPKVVTGSQVLPSLKRIASPPSTPKVVASSPVDVKQSPNELITSLVSDWDDEPAVVLKHEPSSPVKPVRVEMKPAMPPPPPPAPAEDPLAEAPKRKPKKKIIWDPDNPETHKSFASFVKSNRSLSNASKQAVQERAKEAPEPARPTPAIMRRKRAESVAVHMIKDPPYTPPTFLKRARTPEPVPKAPRVAPAPKAGPGNKRGRKSKSELDRLLGDEGAINMLYDLECENSNKDLLKDSDLKLDDSEDEDEKLLAKAKIIADVVKQGTSPNEPTAHISRVRAKRAPTPHQTSVSPVPPPTTSAPASAPAPARKPGPGRKRKQTANRDWDNEDSMIIRRRSNSDSSSASSRRLSVEQAAPPSSHDSSTDNFEFVKPTDKQSPKTPDVKLDSSLVANMKGKLSKVLGSKPKKEEDPLSIASSPEKKPKLSSPNRPKPLAAIATTTTTATVRIDENGLSPAAKEESFAGKLADLKLTQLTCRLVGNYAEITLSQSDTKLKDVFTIELMNDLKSLLNLLKGESGVRAVLIRSINRHFCRGIDVSYLIQPNAEKRKNAAQVLSGHLRNFLQTLATFNKPLVAAVHGDVLGLGVTILPLFEVVVAQDTCTFSTPYGIFGHLPEAMKIFTTSKNLKPKAITDLLYMCKKVSAASAQDFGLVSEVVPPEKLLEKATSVTKKLASLSPQALRSIKSSLRQDQLARLDEQLTAEQKKLSQQWITAECQEKFKMFCSRGGEW